MKPRDLMAPDTEPTDEELELVMREARDLAVSRRALRDAWIAARLEEASRYAQEHARPRRDDKAEGVVTQAEAARAGGPEGTTESTEGTEGESKNSVSLRDSVVKITS